MFAFKGCRRKRNNKMKKGNRKTSICIIGFVWALIVLVVVKLLFDTTDALIPIYSFGSSIVLYLFAANYGEHREEKRNED